MVDWQKWPRELRLHDAAALEAFRAEHAEQVEFWAFVQYEFDRQWRALHTYAKSKNVAIMGDIPIYVAADSADAWAGRQLFEMDADGRPRRVAGCPPDYFSADGQLWGNPLYDWNYHRDTGYAWWTRRVRHALSTYDILRIDHFRGFDTYWAIPAFPGMKVLQFAFTGEDSVDLPHNYPRNCVAYPGTHDNNTLKGWFEGELGAAGQKQARAYFALTRQEGELRGLLRGVLASPAVLAIVPLADWLEEPAASRMNTPGKAQGNWCWRVAESAVTPALAKEIRALCARYFRAEA